MSGKPDVTVKEAITKRASAEAAILQIVRDYSEQTGLSVDAVDLARTAMGELLSVGLRVRMRD